MRLEVLPQEAASGRGARHAPLHQAPCARRRQTPAQRGGHPGPGQPDQEPGHPRGQRPKPKAQGTFKGCPLSPAPLRTLERELCARSALGGASLLATAPPGLRPPGQRGAPGLPQLGTHRLKDRPEPALLPPGAAQRAGPLPARRRPLPQDDSSPGPGPPATWLAVGPTSVRGAPGRTDRRSLPSAGPPGGRRDRAGPGLRAQDRGATTPCGHRHGPGAARRPPPPDPCRPPPGRRPRKLPAPASPRRGPAPASRPDPARRRLHDGKWSPQRGARAGGGASGVRGARPGGIGEGRGRPRARPRPALPRSPGPAWTGDPAPAPRPGPGPAPRRRLSGGRGGGAALAVGGPGPGEGINGFSLR